MKKIFVLITLILLSAQVAWAAKPKGIEAKHAFRQVGKTTTVCGVIASARYLQGSGREPTFLNFADTYRKYPFTALIWGETRSQFDYAPETLEGKEICVRGVIGTYKSKPQIVVEKPSQITVVEGD